MRSLLEYLKSPSLLAGAALCLSALAAVASEPVAESLPVTETPAPVLVHEWAPSPGIAVAVAARPVGAPEIKPVVKQRSAKKVAAIRKSMLSRSARNQMALLAAPQRPSAPLVPPGVDEDNDDDGISDLDIHRSYHRPRVVKVFDEDEDENTVATDLSDTVKLRLFLARMKAIEAHQRAHCASRGDLAGDSVPESVKLRLLLARRQAVEAHRKKYS